jgi:thioredoxin-like negative regulator of GroEL
VSIESSQALERALGYARQGRLGEARQLWEGVLAAEPANPGALSCLGEVLLAMRHPEAALAVECGLPIVTRQGRFLRGRFAGGILASLGLGELVAADENAYVELAVQLAGDPARRRDLRHRMEAERGALFDDVETVRELEEHLVGLARG